MRHGGLNRKSIFVKTMAVSVAAMLVLYLFSLYIYNTAVNQQKEKLTQQVESIEGRYIGNMEQDVARIKAATVKSFLKPDWSILSFHHGLIRDYTFLQSVLRAQERLEAIRNISPVIYDASACFPFWGRTISSLKGLGSFDGEAFSSIVMPLDAMGAQFVYYQGQIYLTSAYRFKTADNFSIIIRLDKQQMSEALRSLNTTDEGMTFLVESSSGEMIASSGAVPAGGLPTIPADTEKPAGTLTANIDGRQYIGIYSYSPYLGFTVLNLVPSSTLYKPLEIYYTLFVVFSSIVLLTIAAIIYYLYRVVGKPMKRLTQAFESMEKGDFSVRLVPGTNDDFAFLYTAFDHMARNTEHLINEVYEKELLVERSRLKQLQAQINPHFLYNSFYTLHRMIKIGDNENSETFSAKLGRYFQYITRDAQDSVPLKTELEHAGIYADIMAVRYGGAVDIEIAELPYDWQEQQVPRLILQPLLENAFEHGMKQRTGKGKVRMSFCAEDSRLMISVDDNGNGIEQDELIALNKRISDGQGISEITGLSNINRRIRLTFGDTCGLSVSQSDLGGAKVTLVLSKTEGKE